MLCNLAEIKMLPDGLLRSNSTFSDELWIYGEEYQEVILFKINRLFWMFTSFEYLRVNGLILPEVTIERLIDYTQMV